MFARPGVSRFLLPVTAVAVAVFLVAIVAPHARLSFADSTGALSPTAVSEGVTGGIATWDDDSDLVNIFASDDARAVSTPMGAGEFTNAIRARGFDFSSIPDTATILGIEVSIEKSATVSGTISDRAIRLFSTDGLAADNKADVVTTWSTDDGVTVYGSDSDLWGSAWTVEKIKSDLFSVVLLAQNVGAEHAQAQVDHISVVVTYVDNPETVQPTVVISSSLAVNPTNVLSIPITVTFSEPVVGFEESDVALSGATISDFLASSSTVYTFNVVAASDPASITVDVPADAATDLVGNQNVAAAQLAYSYDSQALSILITGGPDEGSVVTDSSVSFQFETDGEFAACAIDTEPSIGVHDCTLFAAPSGAHGLSGLSSAQHTFYVKVGASSTSDVLLARTFIIDTERPSVSLSSVDVVSTWASTTPISVSVAFSSPVSGFDDMVNDISVSGGVIHDLVGSGSNYTFSITPTAPGILVSIPEGAATETNGSGWTNLASPAFVFSYDSEVPSFTVLAMPEHDVATSTNDIVLNVEASDNNSFTIECTLDDIPVACTMPHTFADVADGAHTLGFAVVDEAGNATSSSVSFTVDTTAPILAEVTPIEPSDNAEPEYVFTSTEEGDVTVGGSCSAEPVSIASGTSTIAFNALSPGTYSDCTVIVIDALGNASTPLAVSSFVVESQEEEVATATISNGPPVAAAAPQGAVLGASIASVSQPVPSAPAPVDDVQTVPIVAPTPRPALAQETVEVIEVPDSGIPEIPVADIQNETEPTEVNAPEESSQIAAAGTAEIPLWAMALVIVVLSILGWGLLWRFVR